MNELVRTIERAVSKNWIPINDSSKVESTIRNLANKYGFNADDFAIFTHTESFGMNPAAWNGDITRCAGIIQFCPDRYKGKTKTIGGTIYNTSAIRKMSILQQLDLVDTYFNTVIPTRLRQNITLGNLYFFVLYPGIGQRYNSFSDDKDLKGLVGRQASSFYNSNGTLTKASVLKALLKTAESNLGGTVFSSPSSSFSNNSIPSTKAGIGVCSEIFPVRFTVEESLFYAGCFSRPIGNAMGPNTNLGYSANGMGINGATNFNISDFDPTVEICNGCLGFPFKTNVRITSPFCQRRISKTSGNVYYHSGTDYGGLQGQEVIAVADGTVISPLIAGDGYNPGFIDIQHEHLGGLVSRSAHIIPSVRPGDRIRQGDIIGQVGPYPSGGPHLHLELRKDKGAGGSARSVHECTTIFLDPALFCRRT